MAHTNLFIQIQQSHHFFTTLPYLTRQVGGVIGIEVVQLDHQLIFGGLVFGSTIDPLGHGVAPSLGQAVDNLVGLTALADLPFIEPTLVGEFVQLLVDLLV